jgi:hypothetical protein
MGRASRLGALLLAGVTGVTGVTGCAVPATPATLAGAGPTTAVGASSASVVAADADVGNGRPLVTHDGLMVRRRVVIAILPTPGADVAALRRALDRAAAARHSSLSDISPSVLDPAEQEALQPDLTLLLPAGATLADAREVVVPVGARLAALPGVQDYEVASVLVHDLRFTVEASDPPALAAAIAREGILTDALGSYSTSGRGGRLEITYTGPLLSDALVEVVRGGIARGEGVPPSAVTLAPRSTTGAGVTLADEPAPAPVVDEVAAAGPQGHHGRGSQLPTSALVLQRSESSSGLWVVTVVAGAVWLVVMLVLLRRRRAPPGR